MTAQAGEKEGRLPDPAELARWPEPERRHLKKSDRHYLSLSPLSAALRAEIKRTIGDRTGLRMLDVGCGNKPYLPFLADHAGSYWGVDAVDGARVDRVSVAEELPFGEAEFDVVICTQVLEHVDDPVRVLAEIYRVLAPGGVVFLSTHGVFIYHPDPPTSDRDYWRWTHSGLLRIFRQSGEYTELEIVPQGNVVASLGYVAAQYVDELGQRLPGKLIGRLMLLTLNSIAEWVDRRFPPGARVPAPGSMSSNFLVTGRKAD
ncbi:MAG: class I SAM-dependent methyltransferase [Solirubrobacterales bacterium]|nr:class I SAM-dependent methyltransferase [Solirubrobacterales bacterium]